MTSCPFAKERSGRPILHGGVILLGVSQVRETVKLAPSAPSGDGTARARPPSSTSEIARAPRSAIVCTCPSLIAEAALKLRLPNCEIGSTRRREDGASWIHSAELRLDAYCTVRSSVCPDVRFTNAISQVSPDC